MAIAVRGLTPLIQVYDMPTSIRYYRALGFEIVSTSPNRGEDRFHWAWLRLGGADLMLNTAWELDEERPPQREAAWMKTHGDTGLYFGCPDVDAAYQELLAKGIAADKPSITRYGMRQMYLRDPDGYTLCFQWEANGAGQAE